MTFQHLFWIFFSPWVHFFRSTRTNILSEFVPICHCWESRVPDHTLAMLPALSRKRSENLVVWGKKINVIINKREDLSTQMGTHVMLPLLPKLLLPPMLLLPLMLPKLPMLPDFHKREKEPKVFWAEKNAASSTTVKFFLSSPFSSFTWFLKLERLTARSMSRVESFGLFLTFWSRSLTF